MNKNTLRLAQIGILLPLLAVFIGGTISTVLSVASMIMVLIAHYQFSKHYKNSKVFNLYLAGYIVMYAFLIISLLGLMNVFQNTLLPQLISLDESLKSVSTSDFATFMQELQKRIQEDETFAKKVGELMAANLSTLFSYIGLMFIGIIVSLILFRNSLVSLAKSSKVNEFKTAGLLYLISAFTLFIGVGLIVMFVGYVFQIVGYFNMKGLNEEDTFEDMRHE
jgi:uncharacterized membrane protein